MGESKMANGGDRKIRFGHLREVAVHQAWMQHTDSQSAKVRLLPLPSLPYAKEETQRFHPLTRRSMEPWFLFAKA
jgi:hypothetical protein